MLTVFLSVIAVASFVRPEATRRSIHHLVIGIDVSIMTIYQRPSLSCATYQISLFLLNVVSLVLFLAVMTVSSVYHDVQGYSCILNIPERRVSEGTGIPDRKKNDGQTIELTVYQLSCQSTLDSSLQAESDTKEREPPIPKINDISAIAQPNTPLIVPDEHCQEIDPENAIKEKEQPASVATIALLTNTSSFRTVSSAISVTSSQTPSPCASTGQLESMSHLPEDPPIITLEEDNLQTRKLHKRSVSNASLALSINSQKSLSSLGSKVKKAFSKLHRRDGVVFPEDSFSIQEVDPSSAKINKPSDPKALSKLLK